MSPRYGVEVIRANLEIILGELLFVTWREEIHSPGTDAGSCFTTQIRLTREQLMEFSVEMRLVIKAEYIYSFPEVREIAFSDIATAGSEPCRILVMSYS